MPSRWHAFVRGAWQQLPVETAIVAAAAVGAIGLVHRPHEVWFARLVLAGLVAAPLALAAHRLARRVPRVPRITGAVAAAGALAAVSAGLGSVDGLQDAGFGWPYLLMLVAALLVPFVVPGPGFARFVRRFFEQTTIWAVLTGCGLAALGVVALALEQLFDLRIDELGLDAAVVLGSGFVLIYLHRLVADAAADRDRMPELWRRLATMIGAPFVSVMLGILVVYEIVVRARGELPRNVLSPLILAAGAVGFVTTLIMASVLGEDGGTGVLAPADPHRWARRWSVRLTRAFPLVLLVLLPMAGWTLWLRIAQHGVTPFRAVRGMGLLCLTVLSVLGTLRWLRRRAALSWEVPVVILGFALVTAFGPISAMRLSIRSQAHRVARALDEAGAGRSVAETVATAPGARRFELAPERHAELRDALRTLAELGGEPAVRRVLTGAAAVCAVPSNATACLERLGVYPRGDAAPAPSLAATPAASSGRTTTLEAHGRFPTAAGEVELIELSRQPDDPDAVYTSAPAGTEFWLGPDRVVIRDGGAVVAEASLAALIEPPAINVGLPTWTRVLTRPDGKVAAELAVERLELWQAEGKQPQVVRLSGIVIWRP